MRAAIALLIVAAGISGCTTDDTQRLDGLTYSAGDAIATNTVLQMVDPWQDGVQHTDLKVPAERPAPVAAASADTAATSDASAAKDN